MPGIQDTNTATHPQTNNPVEVELWRVTERLHSLFQEALDEQLTPDTQQEFWESARFHIISGFTAFLLGTYMGMMQHTDMALVEPLRQAHNAMLAALHRETYQR